MVTKNTPLFNLYKKGEYRSYMNEELIDVITDIKKHTPYWVRIMRTIRDIPATSIESGSVTSNLRQVILERAIKEGWQCHCIRCREIGSQSQKPKANSQKLYVEEYEASDGKEIFLSYESVDRKLYSLLRLRLTSGQFINELKGAAIIREVHTYGQEIGVGEEGKTQHVGFGKKLVIEAEKIAQKEGYNKIAVISGVGVRDYYRKLGYNLIGEYMVKEL